VRRRPNDRHGEVIEQGFASLPLAATNVRCVVAAMPVEASDSAISAEATDIDHVRILISFARQASILLRRRGGCAPNAIAPMNVRRSTMGSARRRKLVGYSNAYTKFRSGNTANLLPVKRISPDFARNCGTEFAGATTQSRGFLRACLPDEFMAINCRHKQSLARLSRAWGTVYGQHRRRTCKLS
jgi:hypothetical protein